MRSSRLVLVPSERMPRWVENFGVRHGGVSLSTAHGGLVCSGGDGASAVASLPFARPYDGQPDVSAFAAAAVPPTRWGLLLVRKGGFAVAVVEHGRLTASKVGQRHVQGRTKAGGQSQQRFARRRENQAREAYAAAAEHAFRLLVAAGGPVDALVCGGDRQAVEAVLSDSRLSALSDVQVEPWLAVPDPRRAVLDQALLDARAIRVVVEQDE